MQHINREYDAVVILDADNIMAPGFLRIISSFFEKGAQVVQGHRVAKNTNTSFALLDAISEEINNSLFRKGQVNLGLSASLIGSGMAFEWNLFKEVLFQNYAVGGFDKELELQILKKKIKIEYAINACVYDEKVQKAEVFVKQRRRWLAAQFYYFSKGFHAGLKDLVFTGNFNHFNKTLQFLLPPRILQLGFLFICSVIFPFFSSLWLNQFWPLLFLTLAFSLMVSIPMKYYSFRTFRALLILPYGFFLMLVSIIKIKGANLSFIHTEHNIAPYSKNKNNPSYENRN